MSFMKNFKGKWIRFYATRTERVFFSFLLLSLFSPQKVFSCNINRWKWIIQITLLHLLLSHPQHLLLLVLPLVLFKKLILILLVKKVVVTLQTLLVLQLLALSKTGGHNREGRNVPPSHEEFINYIFFGDVEAKLDRLTRIFLEQQRDPPPSPREVFFAWVCLALILAAFVINWITGYWLASLKLSVAQKHKYYSWYAYNNKYFYYTGQIFTPLQIKYIYLFHLIS